MGHSTRFINAIKQLIRENKIYFLAPLVILIMLFAILFFVLGSGAVIAFIYSGV